MAAEVSQRYTGWTCADLSCNDHLVQDASVPQVVLDHGSISFGRFAAEPLSWEKRSVFTHNRRQEELSKLTLPGLVAQKKAFFEEYYNRARTLKALEVTPQTEVILDNGSDGNISGRTREEDQLPEVISEDGTANATNSSLEPLAEVSLSDEKKCQEPHDLGYLTFNPLFSHATSLQNFPQEESSTCAQKQQLDREFACDTHTTDRHQRNLDTLDNKGLPPKHVVSAYNTETHFAKIVLPKASLKSEGSKCNNVDKPETRKNLSAINRSTTRTKEPSASLIHIPRVDSRRTSENKYIPRVDSRRNSDNKYIPRVDSRRNSENKYSQDMKHLFHKTAEMKLRALSDRLNVDRVKASSRSASLASQKPPREVQPVTTLPRSIFFGTGSQVSHAASSNNNAAGRLAAKSLTMPNSSQVNGKNFGNVQVTAKKAASLTGGSNKSENQRDDEMVRKLITPMASEDNSLNRRYVYIPAPPMARSRSTNLLPRETARAPKTSYGKNAAETKVDSKSTSARHLFGARNVAPKHTVNCNAENIKVVSSHSGNLPSNKWNNLSCGLSLSKNKPRQEKPRWR